MSQDFTQLKIIWSILHGQIKEQGHYFQKKRVPKSMKDFAKLDIPEQSHILPQIFEWLPSAYNKSLDQYGKQIQRYMRKLYQQQFEKCTPRNSWNLKILDFFICFRILMFFSKWYMIISMRDYMVHCTWKH